MIYLFNFEIANFGVVVVSYIKGKLVRKGSSFVEIESNGVGYQIFASLNTISAIGDVGSEVKIHTFLLLRDENLLMFGFASLEEKEIFKELINISSIGPKIALAILSYLSVEEFLDCVAKEKTVMLTGLPGIGRKTAERIILEFREKVKKFVSIGQGKEEVQKENLFEEGIAALTVLGYPENKARSAIAYASREIGGEPSLEDLVKTALKLLNR